MIQLTKSAEKLLQEILAHRLSNGMCDSEYWRERFESLSEADDIILRSSFKALKDASMISITWADDYPYFLQLHSNGISYFDEKKSFENNTCSNINNFFGPAIGVQIQQGSINSTQYYSTTSPVDESNLIKLISYIRQNDSMLVDEYGVENAVELRKTVDELESIQDKPNCEEKKRRLINYIRELSINAAGGIISSGIFQLISMIMR